MSYLQIKKNNPPRERSRLSEEARSYYLNELLLPMGNNGKTSQFLSIAHTLSLPELKRSANNSRAIKIAFGKKIKKGNLRLKIIQV